RHHGLRGRLRLAAALRREHFDLAVLFQKAFEAAALAFLAGARHRVGLATDRRSFLLTHALEPPPADTHHLEVFLGIARALGCPIEDPYPSFHLSQVDRELAATLLAEAGLSSHAPLLAFHPGASKEPRAWHPQRFAELGRRLAQTHGARLILFGSAAEHGLLRQIAGDLPSGRVLVPPPGLSIKMSGGILERCHLFVGNDSGPMHVAAALGVPTVGIFGPGTPRRTRPTPRGGRVVTIGGDYPCSPCRQDFFRECPPAPSGKPFCLEAAGRKRQRSRSTPFRTGFPAPRSSTRLPTFRSACRKPASCIRRKRPAHSRRIWRRKGGPGASPASSRRLRAPGSSRFTMA